ncbi:MAG: histidine phosphatase family protein [Dehalococcoidia bacterium]|nr:histidine phosphatase family protein [Dehalococcoidia bacterium]
MNEIVLLRHGKTQATEKQFYCGQTDLPLSESGKEELCLLRRQNIYPPSVDKFFSSGLLRAEQTIDVLYGKVERVALPDLKEYNFGHFEMKGHLELSEQDDYQAWINDSLGTVSCPGGESRNEVRSRVAKGYAKLLESVLAVEKQLVLAVCHGGTIAVIMDLIRPNTDNFAKWLPAPGRGYWLQYRDGCLHDYHPVKEVQV